MSTGLGEIVLCRTTDGGPALDVRLERESVWLSLNQLADLFERDKSVISRHLRNVFKEGELERSVVVAKNATTAADGKTYQVEHFNLDAIISVGYRVNSLRGTQFRIWAATFNRFAPYALFLAIVLIAAAMHLLGRHREPTKIDPS